MLLEFTMSNYKSFKEETVFSLVPAPKQKGLDYSILEAYGGRKKYKGLCSSVIYGPNAAGKTNIIGAMDTFRAIVLRGHIRNGEDRSSPNVAASFLELIPNITVGDEIPVSFAIKFIENGILFDYSVSLRLGSFMSGAHDRSVVSEQLSVNNFSIFLREKTVALSNLNKIKKWLSKGFRQKTEDLLTFVATASLVDDELFLMNGFKTLISNRLVSIITEWLSNNLKVVYRADSIMLSPNIRGREKNSAYIEKTMNEAAKEFGISSNDIAFVVDDENSDLRLCSVVEVGDEDRAIPIEVFESFGTVRFVNLFPIILNAIMNGRTLVVDEFDASMHPMALMSIINIFHNNEVNKQGAQLIFNTHNPIFLNSNLFRRDEIKFVERDKKTHNSTVYALSDFGTSGSNAVRKNEDYMHNYFIDRYGAIQDVDFFPLFEKLVYSEEEGG